MPLRGGMDKMYVKEALEMSAHGVGEGILIPGLGRLTLYLIRLAMEAAGRLHKGSLVFCRSW